MISGKLVLVAAMLLGGLSGCLAGVRDEMISALDDAKDQIKAGYDKVKDNYEKKKFRHSLAKINKYLVDNLDSEDPKINLAKLEDILDGKASSSLDGSTTSDVIKQLVEFAATPEDESLCDFSRRKELITKFDMGLKIKSRMQLLNSPLTRLDKMIHYYALEDARHCGFDYNIPSSDYIYKQFAYDEIDARLTKALPETDDVDVNMAKAMDILSGLNPADGALADALNQFLMLRTTLMEDSCNEKGQDIILKNDLGTRRKAHGLTYVKDRRIDLIFKHYAEKHEQMCRPVYFNHFKSELTKLDQETYRLVLGLVSATWAKPDQFPSVWSNLIEELKRKEVNEDFSTQVLVEIVERWLARQDKEYQEIGDINRIPPKTNWLRIYIRAFSVDDPDSKFLDTAMRDSSDLASDQDKYRKFLDRYLFKPCRVFLNKFQSLVLTDQSIANMDRNHLKSKKSEFIEHLTYHSVRAGYQACIYVNYHQKEIAEGILNYIV